MKNILILLFFSLLYEAAFSKDVQFVVEIDTSLGINYGTEVPVYFYTLNEKGKKKPIYGFESDQFKIEIKNGYFRFVTNPSNELSGVICVSPYPKSATENKCDFSLTFTEGKKTFNYSVQLKLNYRPPLVLNYNGFTGSGGVRGKNKTVAGTILFYGGNNGETGKNGEDGCVIKVYVKKTDSTKVHVRVLNNTDRDTVDYYLPFVPDKILVLANGGAGGTGGAGQSGKKGRGDAGENGGDGGNGGNGGSGGSVEVIIHPNAISVQSKLVIENKAGSGGSGGKGGTGGRGGKDDAGNKFPDGMNGKNGSNGWPGANGFSAKISIAEF